ncbi:MAG: ATP-binding protein [Clostridia bacterium]|nr:ATP-binding protein [Clostridia bacterium]
MEIKRNFYLAQLTAKMHNGRIKIITGIRRCGKSYLLFNLFRNYLLENGVSDTQIIGIALDRKEFEDLRNPNLLYDYILARIDSSKRYYVFVDEIQLSYKVKRPGIDEQTVAQEDRDLLYTTFYDVLNDLRARDNLDIYVTGSNSRLLSKDVATNFRDRGVEIRLHPLSFSEYYPVCGKEKADAWEEYLVYGGMPLAVLEQDEREKARYLSQLFQKVYIADVAERYGAAEAYMNDLIDTLCSAVGSLTNPMKLANTLNTVRHAGTTDKTVKKYLDLLEDAFLFRSAKRYDVKGKALLGSPLKYYAEDVGLRNARLNFRQTEQTHLMENIIFNELIKRGYSVDVGVVRYTETENGKPVEKRQEIDFVVNLGDKRIYIQSAFSIADEEKRMQEIKPLLKSRDFFRKMVVVGGSQKARMDENGIVYIGIIPFLLDENSLNG